MPPRTVINTPEQAPRSVLANLFLNSFKFAASRHAEAERLLAAAPDNPKRIGYEQAFREMLNFLVQQCKSFGINDPKTLVKIAQKEEKHNGQ